MTSMRAVVELELADGARVELGPGDLIGRVASAALVLDDPRISEAHAMVSLRRGELYLLSLRRMLAVDGKPSAEVLLAEGLRVELAEGVTLTVVRVTTPARVAGLRAPGLGTRPLGQVASIVVGPPLRIIGRFVPDAAAHLWSAGPSAWRVRGAGQRTRALEIDDTFEAAGVRFTLCAVELAATNHAPTQGGGIAAPLHVIAHYDSVEIHRSGRPVVTVGGVGARMLSELIAFGGPVSWEVIARELWRDEADQHELRHRWDVALGRLRTRLRDENVRADLLRSDGSGRLQLVMYEGDRVDDRT